MNPESNDEQLERARREIRAQAALLHERPLQARTPPPATRAADSRIEPSRRDYRIGELTGVHYRAFVEQAFHALLKRAPAMTESEAHIAALAAGATKAEVLGNLRWSPEGRHIGARVAGLLPRYASAKARRIPLLGYLLDLGLNLAALPQLARHQRASDTLMAAADEAAVVAAQALARRLDELGAAHNQRLDELAAARDLLRQRVDDLHAYAHELSVARDALAGLVVQMEHALRSRIEELESTTTTHGGRLDEFAFLRQRVLAMNHWSHNLTTAFARIDTIAGEREAVRADTAASTALTAVAADHARGTRNAAWAVAFAATMPARGSVLALACAGDWPALLGERGFGVSSTEANPVLAEAARRHGVVVDPALAHDALLRSADQSLDGVSMLAYPVLARITPVVQLLADASRVLRSGGALLLADAREPSALVDALLGGVPAPIAPDLMPHALAAAGFIDISRIDGTDGTPAWLARKA